MFIDFLLDETGNGGDMQIAGNDIVTVSGFENMPYLSMFGGRNWWGNELLLSGDGDFQFLATTEATILTTPLNSQGRLIIREAILQDLAFIKTYVPGTVIEVDVTIVSDNVLSIVIGIDGETFYYYWNPVKKMLQRSARARMYVTEDGGQIYYTEDGSQYYEW